MNKMIPGFRDMRPLTKLAAIGGIYGLIPTILASFYADLDVLAVCVAIQGSSLAMLVYFGETGRYWK